MVIVVQTFVWRFAVTGESAASVLESALRCIRDVLPAVVVLRCRNRHRGRGRIVHLRSGRSFPNTPAKKRRITKRHNAPAFLLALREYLRTPLRAEIPSVASGNSANFGSFSPTNKADEIYCTLLIASQPRPRSCPPAGESRVHQVVRLVSSSCRSSARSAA